MNASSGADPTVASLLRDIRDDVRAVEQAASQVGARLAVLEDWRNSQAVPVLSSAARADEVQSLSRNLSARLAQLPSKADLEALRSSVSKLGADLEAGLARLKLVEEDNNKAKMKWGILIAVLSSGGTLSIEKLAQLLGGM